MAKLYPPVIEGTIPAFNGAVLTVPFSMNRSVSKNEISGFALKVKTVQSNTYLTTLISNTPDENMATFSINSNDWTPTPGQFYKVQLAYINNGTIGYYSTVGVIKYTAINSNNLRLIGAGGDDMTAAPSKLYGFRHDYSGVYDYSIDPMEKVYTYQFQLLNAADEVVYDSGILLHNVNQDSVNTSIDSYTFLDDLEEGETLYLQYHVTTVNGLELFTPKIAVVAIDELIVDKNITLVAENNYDNGYVQLNFHGIEEDGIEEYLVGQYRIYRCNIKTPKRWEPIASFVLQKQQPSEINNLRDFTVEHNETYKYKLCQFNDHNLLALINYSNEVYVDFEDMFLFDGTRQLKVQYNPKVSSFKNDILESKIDTIGSKYPFFFRNGTVHYKEFPVSGLISYWVDNEELFKPLKDIGVEDASGLKRRDELLSNPKTMDLVNYNIAAERQFKLDVLEWLTNGKPKLFRSPAEGNYIVRLMNTSLTPNDTVGRMLHTFNSTAYEIDEYNYYNLSNYGFISGNAIVNNDLKLRFRTIDLMEWVDRSFVKDGDYYEVLLNPYGNHGKILAQSILIEDCDYGDIFYINSTNQTTNKIMIGATGSYHIENLFPIESIRFKIDEIQAFKQDGIIVPFDAVVHSPKVTYSYYDTFNGISLFDNITNISIASVPARQFMNNGTNMWNKNIVKEIENISTKVLKYHQILLEKRPVEEIYSIVNIPLTNSVKSLLNTGFNENYTNRLFTFDRTGWGRGAGRMAQVSFDTQRNFASGKTPFQIIQSMPFCLFHISPITLLTKDQWTELQRQSVILANVLHQAALPDDVIRRVTNLVTTENFDELKDTCAEFLAQMQEEDNQYHLTDEQISVIYNYVALLNEYAEVMRGYPIESYNDYVLTTDTTPKSKKAYFIRLNSPNDEAEAIYMQTTFGTNSVEKTKFRNLCNAHLIYERKSETMQLTTPVDLYFNYDFNKFAYDKDYYLVYDPTLNNNNGGIILFDSGEYSTRVYFNTGDLDGVNIDASEYVDLADMKQSALYLDIDTLTDMYVGNGVIATLTYTYSVTTYTFEEEDALIIKRSEYTDAIDAYNTAIKNYVGWDAPDPVDALSSEGSYTLGELVKQKYKEYIEVLDARLTQWRRENEANG